MSFCCTKIVRLEYMNEEKSKLSLRCVKNRLASLESRQFQVRYCNSKKKELCNKFEFISLWANKSHKTMNTCLSPANRTCDCFGD